MSVIFHILGMIVGGVLIGWRIRRAGLRLDTVRFIVGCVFLIVLGVAGTRVAYIFADLPYYVANWREIFSLYGTIIPGAIVFGLLGLIPLARFLRIPFWQLGDLFAPGIALGQAIGRIGCLVEGCCYGVPIQLPGLEATGWVYPTQMMHGVANLLIALLLDFLRAVGPVFAPGMPFAGVRVPRVISAVAIVLALIALAWRWIRVRRSAAGE
jgi:prolipoprotein diacylglyceryltransferase